MGVGLIDASVNFRISRHQIAEASISLKTIILTITKVKNKTKRGAV